jgi:asparagine synthase (glutamine-hydrolysing)
MLDRRVVEFSLSLPSAMFLRDGVQRRVFRDAMVGVLPEEVRVRSSKFIPFPGMLIDVAEARDEVLRQIGVWERSETVRRLIDLAELRRYVEALPSAERLRAELRGNYGSFPDLRPGALFHALSAAAWLMRYEDAQTASPERAAAAPLAWPH